MSFGPLLNTESEQKQTNSKRNSNAVRLDYKQMDKGKKSEEGNLSLVSFEETEQEKDKYYSEEELTNIMGIAEDVIQIKGKSKVQIQSKGKNNIIRSLLISNSHFRRPKASERN